MQTFQGVEAQGLGEKLETKRQPLPAQTSLHPLHRQGLKVCAQNNLNLGQRHVGRDLGHAPLVYFQPGPQGTAALGQLDPQRHVMA